MRAAYSTGGLLEDLIDNDAVHASPRGILERDKQTRISCDI